MLLLCLVLLPFAGSLLVAFLPADARNRAAGLAGITALLGLLLTAYLYLWVGVGEVLDYRAQWLPAYGLDFMMRMDGLAWLFSVLVLGIVVLVTCSAAGRWRFTSARPPWRTR